MDSTKHTRNITEQLSQLRDLLIVIERSDDAPDVLYKIAIEKSHHITSLVEAWRAEADPAPVEIPTEYALWIDNDTEACQPECDADEATDVIEVQQFAIEPTEAEVEEVLLDSVMPLQADDEQSAAVEKENIKAEDTEEEEIIEEEEYIAPFVEDDIVADEVPADNVEATEYSEPADEDLFDEIPDDDIYTDEPVHEEGIVDIVDEAVDDVVVVDYDVVASDDLVGSYDDDFDDDDDFMADDDDDDDDDEGDDVETLLEQELVIDEFYNRGEPFDNDTITIGEMMSVRQAKELRKALSLNDRFRFRRELFGNSDVTMNDTLNLIDTMNDYNEALEYLTQDLDWSPEEPVVQEFLQLVERHFKK